MNYLSVIVLSLAHAISSLFGLVPEPVLVYEPTPSLTTITEEVGVGADGFLTVGGTTYALAGSGVSSSATSFTLTSFTIPQSGQKIRLADFGGSILYGTIEPGNRTRQEFVSCTAVTQNANGTATLSGCSRGLAPLTPYTASSTLQFAHAGGATFILSNPPQLYNKAAFKDNDESITGTWDFASTTPPRYDLVPANHNAGTHVATTSEFASVAYVNSIAVSGAANASETVKGLVELSTSAEAAAGTSLGSTGARLALPGSIATSTCDSAANSALISQLSSGKLGASCLNQTENYTWTGTHGFAATTTLAGSDVLNNAVRINSVNYQFPTVQTASSSALRTDGSGRLAWAPSSGIISLNTSPNTISASTASTTILQKLIPANVLGTSNLIKVTIPVSLLELTNGNLIHIDVGYGSASSTLSISNASGGDFTGQGGIDIYLSANASVTSQEMIIQTRILEQSGSTVRIMHNTRGPTTFSQNSAAAQNLTVVVRLAGATLLNFTPGVVIAELVTTLGY